MSRFLQNMQHDACILPAGGMRHLTQRVCRNLIDGRCRDYNCLICGRSYAHYIVQHCVIDDLSGIWYIKPNGYTWLTYYHESDPVLFVSGQNVKEIFSERPSRSSRSGGFSSDSYA
jgi:hypothetical protein